MRLLSLVSAVVLAASAPQTPWLDQPLKPWFVGASVPTAGDMVPSGRGSCLQEPQASRETEQIRSAGWRPFQLFDRPLTRGTLTVFGGLRELTADCAPAAFQVFVFASGRYAGTLSPVEMSTGRDGVVGSVRLVTEDTLTAEFARYRIGDSECCPSGRVRVTYRIDRSGEMPRVVPAELKVLRE